MTGAAARLPREADERPVLVLDRETVRACLAQLDPVAIVQSVLCRHAEGDTVLPAEAYLPWTNGAGAYARCVAMPGGVLGGPVPLYGLKVINAAVSNPSRGLARAAGVTLLFDPDTARPRVLAEAAQVSALRTAAYTVLSLRHLGPERPEAVTLLGCGALARAHVNLLAAAEPTMRTVHVHDLDPARTSAFAAWVESTTRLRAVVHQSARSAVEACNVLVTLTTSDRPYIQASWLPAGTFVAHVSLDDLGESVFTSAQAVFVDDVQLVQENPRRILGRLMAGGTVSPPGGSTGRPLDGTLPGVLIGRHPAVRPREGVVVSNPFGMSVLDIGLVAAVADVAEKTGAGAALQIL